ncbi:MAG: magnetochrome domain-containing protein [Pseudomonadota bacterium]
MKVKVTGYAITSVGFVALLGLVLLALVGQPFFERSQNPSKNQAAVAQTQAASPVIVERRSRKLREQPPLMAYVGPNIRLAEAHWQGLEALPLSAELKQKLRLPSTLNGLLIDEVTLNAAVSGLLAGDVLEVVDGTPVNSLEALVQVSKRVQNQTSVAMTVYRKGQWFSLTLSAPDNLGFVQAETAPMILPGEIMPHPYRGPCTDCHAIGTTGHIVPDPDGIILPPPPISAQALATPPPHKDRGPCQACHQIIP